jgi:hypothetical protein
VALIGQGGRFEQDEVGGIRRSRSRSRCGQHPSAWRLFI